MKNLIKKFSLSKTLDFLFFNFTLFLIFFTWTRFIIKSNLLALILSIAVIIGFNLVKQIFDYIKNTKKNKSNHNLIDMENQLLILIANSNEENLNYFLTFYTPINIKNTLKNSIIFKDNSAICIEFEKRQAQFESILKVVYKLQKLNINKVTILCYSIDKNDKIFFENLENINIKIKEKSEVYQDYLCKNREKSEIFKLKKQSKIKLKQLWAIIINEQKSRGYFLSGLVIFFCSLFMRYNIYYVIMSSILFTLSLISKFNNYHKKI